jgi:hypothetical protein
MLFFLLGEFFLAFIAIDDIAVAQAAGSDRRSAVRAFLRDVRNGVDLYFLAAIAAPFNDFLHIIFPPFSGSS